MKMLTYSALGLILAASAAHAQPADETQGPDAHAAHAGAAPAEPAPANEPATPADVADPAAPADVTEAAPPADVADIPPDAAAVPAPAAPAPVIAAADVTEVEIDSFAQATVKLQEIQANTAIAPEQKQTAMVAAVAEVGLDPAKYNAISRAASTDPTLRAKVQTAMSKYAGPAPSEG